MFEGWNEYFFMIGSSAAALIGLMFVVATLTAGRDRKDTEHGKHLYTSPIVCHLAIILALSGAAIAPLRTPTFVGALSAGLALAGFAIGTRNAIGIARTRISGSENVDFDMWWYGIVPAAVYVGIGAAAAMTLSESKWGASGLAAALMALLLVSIHAEWDLVTFLAPQTAAETHDSQN